MMKSFVRSVVTTILLCAVLATAAGAATFTVNSTADTNDGTCDGANCTLREAMSAANAAGGTDTIDFRLGAGPYTILPLSLLPTISDPVVIDGATGDPVSPRVVITGFIDLAWGLEITAGSSTVKNLVMNNFRSGPAIELNGGSGSVVTGCYLGTNAGGTTAVANQYGVRIRASSNNLVGGTNSADRNVISGNSAGIWVDRNGDVVGPAPGNRFEGNYIGTNATGDAVVAGSTGVVIAYGVNDNTIGGDVAGAGNVISGHTSYGIDIESGSGVYAPTVSGIMIQGNYIGTDATGQLDFGNYYDGVHVAGGAFNITIGGTSAEARNVISGNNRYGILLAPNGASGTPSNNTIQGNYVGTNATGTAAIGNGSTGVRFDTSSNNLIGAVGAAPSNVISGNQIGIQVVLGSGNQVVGNYIGTDATGTVDLGNATDGLDIDSSPDNTIGGTAPGAGNLISGNDETGIRIYSSFGPVSSGTIVHGNQIGTKADGTSALGNTRHGVWVGAPTTTVGGTTGGSANTIAFNGWDGVYVDNVVSNAILGNSIHDSGYLGIDLVPVAYQVNANDSCDPDAGGNGSQNFPVLTASLSGGGQLHVDGTLSSLASTDFRLEFFGNDACDSFGNGEGKTYLGSATVTTDGACDATINVDLPVVVAAGTVITATATRLSAGAAVETSEFSACRAVTACEYSLSPLSDSFPASGGTRSLDVTTASGCNWPAVSNDDWITIDSPASGNGNSSGSVSYTVLPNGGAGRSGSISVAGQSFPVTQDAPPPLCIGPSDCDDINACTDDTCDPVNGCQHTPNDANPCTDGNACTTADHCTAGQCSGSALTCADDNPCTDDTCSPSTGCAYTPNDANSCSDSDLCTTGDHCSGGQCVPSGAFDCDDANPCTQDSCDGECFHNDICGTTTTLPPTTTTLAPATGACCTDGNCSVGTATQCEIGTYQGDGTNCDAPGICSACGNGLIESGEVCDDGNTAAGDGCDDSCDVEACWTCSAGAGPTTTLGQNLPGPSTCTQDNGASCDDGDPCTVGDSCSEGTCGGSAVMIPAACKWVIAGNVNVQSRTRGETQVTGHICGGRVRLGEFSTTNGDAVASVATGIGIQISPHAAVSGDIISGGSSVYGKPRMTLLPGLDVDMLAGASTAVQSGDPSAIYDTLGTNARAADCMDAQDDIAPADLLLASLPAGPSLGDTFIAAGGALTLTATNPGGVSVFDFRKLLSGADATLTLDGAGDAGSVFVLRVEKKLDLRLRSKIVLSNGAVAGNVILYSQAKCRFGLEVTGLGTVFCPNGKLILHPRSQWQGALVGGRRRVELRDSGILTHVPLQVGP